VMVLICACPAFRRQQSPAEVNEALLPRQLIAVAREYSASVIPLSHA
jgi:hypothetical protein